MVYLIEVNTSVRYQASIYMFVLIGIGHIYEVGLTIRKLINTIDNGLKFTQMYINIML